MLGYDKRCNMLDYDKTDGLSQETCFLMTKLVTCWSITEHFKYLVMTRITCRAITKLSVL